MNRLSKFLRKFFDSLPASLPVIPATKKNDFDLMINGVIDYAIIMLDLNGRMVSWNRGAENMIGYTAKEAIGKTLEIVYNKEDVLKRTPWQNLEKVKQLDRVERDGWRLRKDGSGFWANIVFTTLKDNDGKLYGYLIIARDITETKKAQEQLVLFSKQIEQANNSIYTVDSNFRLTSWNSGAEKLYGFTKEEALGRIPNEMLNTEITDQDLSAALHLIDETGYWSGELRRTTKAGKNIYVRSSTSNIKDADGVLTGMIGVSFDITAQKELQAQVNHLATIAEQSTDAINSTDLNRRFTSWNSGCERLFGYSKEEALGKTAADLGFIVQTASESAAFFKSVVENGIVTVDRQFLRKDGSLFYGTATANAVKNEKGEITNLVIIVKDITVRKQLEEHLRKSNEELEQKVKERTYEVYKNEKRFRALVENDHSIITLFDKDFIPIYRSPAAERITGWTAEDRKKISILEQIHPDQRAAMAAISEKVLQNPGKRYSFTTRSLHKSGHYLWLEGVVTNMIDDPDVGGIISNLQDITERRNAEDAIYKSEVLYRNLFENMLHGFAYCKAVFEDGVFKDFIYLGVNSAYESMTGLKDINGKAVSEAMPDILDSDPGFRKRILRVLSTGNPEKFETFIPSIGSWFISSIYSPDKETFVLLIDNITEGKNAEEAIRKSEILYRSLFENMFHGFAYCKPIFKEGILADLLFVAANNEYEVMHGFKDISGKKLSGIRPGLLQADPMYVSRITKVLKSGRPEKFESHVEHLDKWFVSSIYTPDKENFGILVENISERKHAEEAVRKSEALYRSLFENMLHGFAYCKAVFEEGRFKDILYLTVNNEYETMHGFKNIKGKKISQIMPGLFEQMPEYTSILGRVALTGQPEKFEARAVPLDKWFSLSIYSPEKEYFVILEDDISERRKAEIAIHKSEVLYRSLFENLFHGFAYCKGIFEEGVLKDFVYITVNAEFETIHRNKNISGRKVSEIMPGLLESNLIYAEILGRVAMSGLPEKFETHARQLDKWLAISIYSPEKEYFVILADDISERKQSEQEIIVLNTELEERVAKRTEQLKKTNEELEAFSYTVSHDLRAPLRGIIGFAAILEEDYGSKLDDEARRITAVIRNNTIRMGHLIDDLLSFSRMSRQDLVKTNFDTGSMVAEIIRESVLPRENMPGINWIIHTLPAIIADLNTVRQVWVNLISNAVKYTGKKENPMIEIGSFMQDNDMVFFVKDNGVGFDEKYRNKLFRVFQRLHNDEDFEGTGIGLAIVEKIVSKHDGKVWAQAEVNKGACFYFSLPHIFKIRHNINNGKSTHHESEFN